MSHSSACTSELLSARTCWRNIASFGQMIFLQPCFFFSNGRCWIFHWLSTLAKRRRGVGAASFFWRGREKTVLNTWEEDDWWVLWVYYFSAWKLTADLLFFHIFVPTEKKAACIPDCAGRFFQQISKYIYQTKFTLRKVMHIITNLSYQTHH